jgi:hypothetical protein
LCQPIKACAAAPAIALSDDHRPLSQSIAGARAQDAAFAEGFAEQNFDLGIGAAQLGRRQAFDSSQNLSPDTQRERTLVVGSHDQPYSVPVLSTG